MDNEHMLHKTFDTYNEQDLALILKQVGLRMLVLRSDCKDTSFWYGVLMRVHKVLVNSADLTEEEQNLIRNPLPNTNGRIKATMAMRDRTGMQLKACHGIVSDWIKKNMSKRLDISST